MELSITEASKAFKISRQTIHKKITNGKLSKLNNGKIDSSEMLRVFGEPSSEATSKPLANVQLDLQYKNDILQERIKHLEESLRDQKEFLWKAERREENLLRHIEKLTDSIKLLEAPKTEPKPGERKGFFNRLFG